MRKGSAVPGCSVLSRFSSEPAQVKRRIENERLAKPIPCEVVVQIPRGNSTEIP
jgi:hypothetical protein